MAYKVYLYNIPKVSEDGKQAIPVPDSQVKEFDGVDAAKIFVAEHKNSFERKSLHSRFQPPSRSSEQQRMLQAREVNAFVKDVLEVQRKADVVVLGDINDFEFSPTTQQLTEGGVLRTAAFSLPESERYTYVYEGNSQVLDHIMVSSKLRFNAAVEYDVVHVNAEFANSVSDHDPEVARFHLP